MNELARAKKFLYDKLTGDATLTSLVGSRVYDHPGPANNTTWPIVTYAFLGGPDTIANGGVRVLSSTLFVVRAIEKGGRVPAAEADAIDNAIDNQQGPVGGDAYVAYCLRESTFDLTEDTEGVTYRHLGGRYRIDVHSFP